MSDNREQANVNVVEYPNPFDSVDDLVETQELATQQSMDDGTSAVSFDHKPAAVRKRKMAMAEQVHVLHGKTQHLAYLIHELDNEETPAGHVLVRYVISNITEYVQEHRVTPFEVNAKRGSRTINSQPVYNQSSATRNKQQRATTPVARRIRVIATKDNRKPPPNPVSPEQASAALDDVTLASEPSLSSLSQESSRSGKLKKDNDNENDSRASPAIEVLATNPPFDRATLQEMAKMEPGLEDLPGFVWEPFMDDPILPQDYKDYLAQLPLVQAVRCQQAMKAFASLRPFCKLTVNNTPVDPHKSDFLPVGLFQRAQTKGFGLQTIADEWNSGFVTMLKQSTCSFIRPLTGASNVSKPYFLCLMIDTENPLLCDELLLRDWVVRTVSNDQTSILNACGSELPDVIYASATTGFRNVLETFAWAREVWGDLPCIVESRWGAEEDRQHLHHLPGVVMHGFHVTDGFNPLTLWVSEDALYTRLLRMRDHANSLSEEITSHCIAQLIAQFVDSERELEIFRAWPAYLTADPVIDNDTEETESAGDKINDEKDLCCSKLQSKPAYQMAISNGDECDAKPCGFDDNVADLLPYFFKNDPNFQSLTDETEKQLYRAFKSKLWLRVDFWSDEVSRAWIDHRASGERLDMDSLVKRATGIRDNSLYSLLNLDSTPKIGMRVRKQFGGEYFIGTIISEDDLRENDDDEEGKRTKIWVVQYDDEEGDREEFELHDFVKFRQGRNRIPAPLVGRPFRMLELFAGRSVVTEHFFQRLFRVLSIDASADSHAMLVMDVLRLTGDQISSMLGGPPDAIWASPPCVTYSRLSGGTHRKVAKRNVPNEEVDAEWERTEEALEHNFHLLKTVVIMLWALRCNRHATVVIENPVGAMDTCPLMQMAKRLLGLRAVKIAYCAFGRDEQKQTMLWTNSPGLADRLSIFTCANMCPFGRTEHPSGVRGNSGLAHCVIPGTLASVVSRYIDASLEKAGIRYTR